MTSILFVAVLSLVMTGIGWLCVEKLDREKSLSTLERLGVSFTLGFYALYLGVFIIAPYRLDQVSMWSLLAIAAVVSIFGLKLIPWQRLRVAGRLEMNELARDKWLAFLWLTALAITASSLIQALAPPNDYDGLAYHLSMPRLDVEMGRTVLSLKTSWPATFFPTLGSHLTRIALVVADAGAAQMIHGLFGILAAIAAAALALRLGYNKHVALLAAIMFVSIRMVVWQMGSVETDVPLAALAALSLVVYLATRDNKSVGLEVVFGLMVAATILMKYHGLVTTTALVPLILYDLLTRRKPLRLFLVGPAVALIAIMPHLVRDYMLTGNPVFPLMNSIFNPGMPGMLGDMAASFGTGRDIVDVLTAPWNIFILPTHYFDGMVIGAPYLLALAPLVLIERDRAKKWLPALSFVLVYYLFWFSLLSQQVRFLAPIMPILAAMAAAGAVSYWSKIRNVVVLKAAFIGFMAILAVNQSLFVGIFSIIRLPAAIGLMSAATYHNKTPTMGGAFYSTCTYVEDNLKDGERYFLIAPYVSYYCPQAAASLAFFPNEEGWWMTSETPPQMSQEDFLARLNKIGFQYFLIQMRSETRRRIASKSMVSNVDLSNARFGSYLEQAFKNLTPLISDQYSDVYDGKQVLDFLNKQAAQ